MSGEMENREMANQILLKFGVELLWLFDCWAEEYPYEMRCRSQHHDQGKPVRVSQYVHVSYLAGLQEE